MIISLRTLTYDDLKKKLSPEDKIVLWSCDTCIRFSGLGGISKLQVLEDMLVNDGYPVIKKELLGLSCVDELVEDRKFDDNKKEIFDEATAIIVLGCEEAWERVAIAFQDKKVIQVTRSFGFGNISEERGVRLTNPFEDTEFEPVPGGIPIEEVAKKTKTFHTFFDADLKEPLKEAKLVEITVDGKKILAKEGANLMEECEEKGFPIPHLCHMKSLLPTGACRMCLVKIKGRKGLVASCCTLVEKGIEVITEDDEIKEDRRITLELLLSTQEHNCLTCIKDDNCELRNLLREYSVEGSRFGRSFEILPIDESSDAIVKDPNRCILCGRCVRACDEVAGKHNLSFAYRGSRVIIVAGMNKPWADSDCATCMACVYACPTGALYEKMLYFDGQEWKPRKLYGHYYCDRSHLINIEKNTQR
jgi:NAD-dependent dihydropyrimidine dehydrogenase PreA subunit